METISKKHTIFCQIQIRIFELMGYPILFYLCKEMASARLFFRSQTWNFRGEVCNSPSHKTVKLQALEIIIDTRDVFHTQSPSMNKNEGLCK